MMSRLTFIALLCALFTANAQLRRNRKVLQVGEEDKLQSAKLLTALWENEGIRKLGSSYKKSKGSGKMSKSKSKGKGSKSKSKSKGKGSKSKSKGDMSFSYYHF